MFNLLSKPNTRTMLCTSLAVLLTACGGGSGTDAATNGNATTTLATSSTSTPATSAATWTECASEWDTCSFSGPQQVRYGTDGKYAYKNATDSIECSNAVFGDPAVGLGKSCQYANAATTPATPTTPPSTTPTATTKPTSALAPYGQDASLYRLAFQDEFEGTSLDTGKWTDHIWYDPATSTNDYGVNGGSLKIWPQRNASGQFAERILVTDQKYYQTYGYFEMEAKLPIGAGSWPAFWLLNSDNPPAEPEIDIMEAYSGDTTGYWADANKHPIRYGATFFQNGANTSGLQKTEAPATGDLSTGFHKYAVKWEPNQLSFYFDGKLVSTSAVSMSKRMYILLDMQYGSASGSADDTTPTGPSNSFEVNYVRTWQFK